MLVPAPPQLRQPPCAHATSHPTVPVTPGRLQNSDTLAGGSESLQQGVVLRVGADPEPVDLLSAPQSQRPVTDADADGVDGLRRADPFEL